MTDQQQPQQQAAPALAPDKPSIGMGVTALVVSLVGWLFFWIPIFGLILPGLGIIFGGIGIAKNNGKGMAIAGLAMGIIEVLLSLLVLAGLFASKS